MHERKIKCEAKLMYGKHHIHENNLVKGIEVIICNSIEDGKRLSHIQNCKIKDCYDCREIFQWFIIEDKPLNFDEIKERLWGIIK